MLSNIKERLYKILRFSEKYTQTDMVYLAKGGFWLTLGQALSILAAFLLSIAFANLLPKETYGTYKYLLSIFGILAIPTLSGIHTAITQAISKGFENSFFPALKTKIYWGIIGSFASISMALYYYLNNNNELTITFLIAAIFLPFMDSLTLYTAYLNGKKDFKNLSKYSSLSKIIYIIILSGLLFITDNLIILIIAYFVVNTTVNFIFLKITTKNISKGSEKDPQIISYGKNLSVMNIITTISGQLDKILIYNYLGAVDLAIFSFAIIMPENIKGVFKNINVLALPKFSEKSAVEIKKTIFKKMGKLIILSAFITIIYVVVSPYIFRWVFPEYLESIYYSQIFAISIILLPISGLMVTALQSQKAQKALYQYNLSSSIIQILILFCLVHFYGLMGAIVARIISRIISGIISISLLNKTAAKSTNI